MKKELVLAMAVCTAVFCILTGCGSSSSPSGSSTSASTAQDTADSAANAGSSSNDASSKNPANEAENQEEASSASTAATGNLSDSSGSNTEDSSSWTAAAATAEAATSADDLEISHYADIEVDGYGTITAALSEKAAPETVKNFVKLADSGFYDGLTFHRIIDGFMIQGGDPNGDGTGGSDRTIPGEFSKNGFTGNNISHVRGAISMARFNDYDSASSQFFIVQSDSTYLDGEYAGFGFVTDGMEVVDQICQDVKPTDRNGTVPADEQPVITGITIREA